MRWAPQLFQLTPFRKFPGWGIGRETHAKPKEFSKSRRWSWTGKCRRGPSVSPRDLQTRPAPQVRRSRMRGNYPRYWTRDDNAEAPTGPPTVPVPIRRIGRVRESALLSDGEWWAQAEPCSVLPKGQARDLEGSDHSRVMKFCPRTKLANICRKTTPPRTIKSNTKQHKFQHVTFNKKSLSIQKSKERKPIMRRKFSLETDPELTQAKTIKQLQLYFICSVSRDVENIFF